MKAFMISALAAVSLSSTAYAQSERGSGWEFGADVIYQDGSNLSFDGGSSAELQDDFGFAVTFGYRFNERLEVHFGLDWATVDYDVTIQSALTPGLQFTGSGDLEAFTPRVVLNYNFMKGNLTPFVSAGAGWTFVDTNIPQGPVHVGCWWDPWWGQVCAPYQDTKSIDDPTYQLGAGVRWDLVPGYSMRFAYEKHWFDYSNATTTPDFDQFKLGVAFQF
jgi:opacity protein-like surface antigen